MRNGFRALLVLLLVFAAGLVVAQDTTTTLTSNVQVYVVICDNRAVVNLSGTMDAGYDVYYQIYSGAGATGETITSLRQASVDGAYAFSDVVNYNSGKTVAAGSAGSALVFIAREGNSNSGRSDDFIVDDYQDGCNNPQNPVSSSTDTGGTASTTGTSGSSASGVDIVRGASILSPFGGVLNPGISTALSGTTKPSSTTSTANLPVVIGVRPSDTQTVASPAGRSPHAGEIFAECDQYAPGASPGLVYQSDTIYIFWLWYSKTEKQMKLHLDNARYEVTLNNNPITNYTVSNPGQPNGLNFYTFYVANMGNLSPGTYHINYYLTWDNMVWDGYRYYGPQTNRTEISSSCTFTVSANP